MMLKFLDSVLVRIPSFNVLKFSIFFPSCINYKTGDDDVKKDQKTKKKDKKKEDDLSSEKDGISEL